MRLRALLGFVFMVSSFALSQPRFIPGAYGAPDGALTLSANGDYVEPYFATKALLEAQDAGLDVHDTAVKWIAWMLPRQRADGRFQRFCKKTSEWKPCADADADDSMMALWMELLYRHAGEKGLSLEWRQSAEKSEVYLQGLRNRWGVYHVSRNNHVALFMDNIEVFSAFKDVGVHLSRWDTTGGTAMEQQAQRLAQSIQHVFWDKKANWYRMSTQKSKPSFYPDVVGQTYPWLEQMPTPRDTRQAWDSWKQLFADGWLRERYDPHSWGLIALTALSLNDKSTAQCWLNESEQRRAGTQWNILEEAAFQAVHANLSASLEANSCSDLVSGK